MWGRNLIRVAQLALPISVLQKPVCVSRHTVVVTHKTVITFSVDPTAAEGNVDASQVQHAQVLPVWEYALIRVLQDGYTVFMIAIVYKERMLLLH